MARILNIGSVNIDYVYRVPHLLRPGETLTARSRMISPGGKGQNQAIALARAGAAVAMAGRVGPEGGELLDALAEAGVDTTPLRRDGSATGHTVIQVDDAGRNCILYHPGANAELEPAALAEVMANYGPGDVLVLQNEVNAVAELMRQGHGRGMRIAFNPSPFGPEVCAYPLELVHWLLLNEVEAAALVGQAPPEAMMDALAERWPRAAVVLTLGQSGVLYRDAHCRLAQPACRVQAVDTTAAGDTFTGFFLAGLTRGLPVRDALGQATVAAAIAVSRPGAAASIPSLAQVEEARLEPMEPR